MGYRFLPVAPKHDKQVLTRINTCAPLESTNLVWRNSMNTSEDSEYRIICQFNNLLGIFLLIKVCISLLRKQRHEQGNEPTICLINLRALKLQQMFETLVAQGKVFQDQEVASGGGQKIYNSTAIHLSNLTKFLFVWADPEAPGLSLNLYLSRKLKSMLRTQY